MARLLVVILGSILLNVHPGSNSASAGFPSPSAVSFSVGYAPENTKDRRFIPVASAMTAWAVGPHAAVRTSLSYLQERRATTSWDASGLFRQAELQSHFVPLSFGIRISDTTTKGVSGFLEAAPAAFVARLWDQLEDDYYTTVLAGVQAGAGMRFPVFGKCAGEAGVTFYGCESADGYHPMGQVEYIRIGRHPGVSNVVVYAGLAF